MKRLAILFLAILLLAGCSAKSAEQHGDGISVEMMDSLSIKYMTLLLYVNGNEIFREGVINANNSPFEKGEIIWFDVSPHHPNSTVELAISYSENLDETDVQTTEKIDISNASDWVTVKFTNDYLLDLIDKK